MIIRPIAPGDSEALYSYLRQLSGETRQLFAPHPFDRDTVGAICAGGYLDYFGYLALDGPSIRAYAILGAAYSAYEEYRFANYDVVIDHENDYKWAPSVADLFQSTGIGHLLFCHIENDLRSIGAHKIILWGGVQRSNQRAVRFYLKHGFIIAGEFEYHGANYDMVKVLR